MKIRFRTISIIIAVALVIAALIFFIINISKPVAEYKIYLSEMETNLYAYQENVVSAIPAENYTMITFSDKSGKIYTVKGTVNIANYDGEPYVIWTKYRITNSDTVTLYIPFGGVKYTGTISVGIR